MGGFLHCRKMLPFAEICQVEGGKSVKKRRLIWLIVLCCTVLALAGCGGPKGDPEQVLTEYYQSVQDGEYDTAYALFTEATRNELPKDTYILRQELIMESGEFKDFKIKFKEEKTDLLLNGVKYKTAMGYSVTETSKDYTDDTERSGTLIAFVVNDNNEWKISRDPEEMIDSISDWYCTVGYLYREGRHKEKDPIKAVECYQEAIKWNKDNPWSYYSLGLVLRDLGRYEEAINNLNICIEKSEGDSSGKSDAYNLLGNVYSSKGDYGAARKNYEKALELNPDNEYAKTNLNSL